jgi:hypothetical protein
MVDDDGWTFLMLASEKGFTENIQAIINTCTNISAVSKPELDCFNVCI